MNKHMKNNGYLKRSFLTGVTGDAMSALLYGAGYISAQNSAPVGAFVYPFWDQF
ncbi:hypothetical protein [Nitrosomonas sp. Is37]|uniref:hypothetical protein n=1 Tax=Nitrosomonas sp. Is37 TaxID=3080535 RepID=UPI00294B84A4|nr:hypothetical protein [Nitrosomonas sp. Is37]MDV6344200.1 hypothetical protein [Nitrosomonas sp. Is37]